MRVEEVFEHHRSLKVEDLNSNGIERARLTVLMDISETLAMMTDLYGAVHGREIISRQQQQQMAQQNQQQFTGPRPMPQQVSQEEDPLRQNVPEGNG